MKKLISIALSLLLLMALASTALATPFTLDSAGVTIEVPEGMSGADMSDETAYLLAITVDDNENLKYAYMLQYIDAFDGLWLEDLTQEQAEGLVAGVAASLENPTFGTVEEEYEYPLLLAANGDGTQLHYISLLGGWMCDVAVGKLDGVALTEDEIRVAGELLQSIQFAGDEEAVEE